MNPEQLDQVNQLVAALQEHPIWAHTGLLIAVVTGVMLWASGRRVLKPAFALIGALLGGFLGHAAVPALGFDKPFGLPGDVVGAAGGGLMGALGAVLVFRLAIGVLTSSVMAGLGVLAAAAIIQMNPPAPSESPSPAAAEIRPTDENDAPSPGVLPLGVTADDLTNAAKNPGAFARDLYVGIKAEVWDPLSVQQRTLIAGAAFVGLLLGLGASVFFPKKSTAIVTAFAGAGLWLPGVYLLSQALDLPGKALLERSAVQWTAIWIVVSLTGLLIQTVGLKERGRGRDDDRDDDWDEEQRRRRRATHKRRASRERDDDDDDDDKWD
jgi:hypothetical protein